ncbi:MAG: bifunctional diaminohydroxyphosphoribosylaminopyrimidine deaminase/5-amino-6-(5-phosphoribosylamino)uracil reductase RibD [Magnetovibrionaceae bacterium]
MRAALVLAARGLGQVAPNPAVGCVLVDPDQNRVVGRGWTQPTGRPHAETEALGRAGSKARGATAYVTLEPCSHHGRTPPCVDALIAAGIKRCVIALGDPDPRVDGGGIAGLKEAGIEVTTGLMAAEAQRLNIGFLTRLELGRPFVTWKAATSLDGRIAMADGSSQWITGEQARQRGHLMRATHDAIIVGIGTALADKPSLTCRLPGMKGRSPIRVVVDSRGRLPLDHPLVTSAHQTRTWLVTAGDLHHDKAEDLRKAGVNLLQAPPTPDGRVDIDDLLQILGGQGLTRVLLEGGGALSASFLNAGAIDEIAWFRAGLLIGADGIPVTDAVSGKTLEDLPRFQGQEMQALGADVLEMFRA